MFQAHPRVKQISEYGLLKCTQNRLSYSKSIGANLAFALNGIVTTIAKLAHAEDEESSPRGVFQSKFTAAPYASALRCGLIARSLMFVSTRPMPKPFGLFVMGLVLSATHRRKSTPSTKDFVLGPSFLAKGHSNKTKSLRLNAHGG